MTEVSIFDLAAKQARWLMARQSTIAENVAHAASPGYRARDLKGFEQMLTPGGITPAATNPMHFRVDNGNGPTTFQKKLMGAEMVTHSGNTVSLDQQMMLANEVRQAYSLNVGIVKSMHRMILTAVK